MTDVKIERLDQPSRPGLEPKGVKRRRVTANDGSKVTVRSIDANSPTFGEELLYVFARNVERAREENKEIIGTRSGVSGRR